MNAASEKPQQGQSALADDMLHGADAIGSFLGLKPRQVYHQRKRLPVFQIGAALCARKSTLLRWITEQEAKAQVERA
ncbi:DNA-binding protein [Azospirillum brasilense]|nr:DNA-binding protein [Azospirillum argentinense]